MDSAFANWLGHLRDGRHALPFCMQGPGTSERQKAVLMLLLANLFWGLSFPVIKALTLLHARLLPGASTWFSSVYMIAPRFALAVVLLAIWWRGELRHLTRKEIRQGITIGGFAAMGMLLQNDGLQFTSASTSAFLTQLYAVMIPLWLAFRRRHNPGWIVWASCILVLFGVAILGRFDWATLRFGRGEWETLLSSFFFMGQILWLERPEFAANRPERMTFILFATEAAIFAGLAVALTPNATLLLVPWTSAPWVGLTLLLALFCTIAAFSLMNRWQPKISATEAGLIYCVEPIFGSGMALFLPAWFSNWARIGYPNERLTLSLLIGGGFITLANLLIQVRPPARS